MGILKNKDKVLRSGWSILLVYILLVITATILFVISFTIVLIIIGINNELPYDLDILNSTYDFLINRTEIFNIVLMSVSNIVYMLLAIFVWKKTRKKKIIYMGINNFKKTKKQILFGFAVGFVTMIVIAGILLLFGHVKFQYSLLEPKVSINLLWGFIGFVFVAIGEEVFSRGFMMSVLRENNSKWTVLFVSSAIFAISHVGNPGVTIFPIINLFLIGVLLGLIFMKTRSIWTGMGFHLAWNYFQGYIFGFDVTGSSVTGLYKIENISSNIMNGGSFGPEGGLAVTIAVSLAIVFVLYHYRTNQIDDFMDSDEYVEK